MSKELQDKFQDYKKFKAKLKGEYLARFEQIEVYINGTTKLNALEKNNCLLQVLDTFLSGQEDGKSIKELIGASTKRYCDAMIYGESIYKYKLIKALTNFLGALIYIFFIYFFNNFFKSLVYKDRSLVFRTMNFGAAHIILMAAELSIPILIFLITMRYFENPTRCKRVKRITYCSLWMSTFLLYTIAEKLFQGNVITISFKRCILILLYFSIFTLWMKLIMDAIYEDRFEEEKEEKIRHYIESLSKKYNKYKLSCEKSNKQPMTWTNFLHKKVKDNKFIIVINRVYSVVFVGLVILIATIMFRSDSFNLLGILFLLVCTFIAYVMPLSVKLMKRFNTGVEKGEFDFFVD